VHKHKWKFFKLADDYLTFSDKQLILHFGAWYKCTKCKEEYHIPCSGFYFHPLDAEKYYLPKWSFWK